MVREQQDAAKVRLITLSRRNRAHRDPVVSRASVLNLSRSRLNDAIASSHAVALGGAGCFGQ